MPLETYWNAKKKIEPNTKCQKLYNLYYYCLVSKKKECNLLKESVNQCLRVKKYGTGY